MSATDELIQNVYEFRGLLRYLGENYPKILTEWKNKNAVVTSHSSRTSSETGNSGGDPKLLQF